MSKFKFGEIIYILTTPHRFYLFKSYYRQYFMLTGIFCINNKSECEMYRFFMLEIEIYEVLNIRNTENEILPVN